MSIAINDTTLTMRRFSPPTTPGQQHHAATAKDDDEKNLRGGLSEFERMRERRIAKNMQRMREMGLEKIAFAPPWQSPIVVDGQTPRKVRPPRRFDFFYRVERARVSSSSTTGGGGGVHLCRRRRFVFQIVQTRAFAEENRRLKRPLIDKILFSLNRKGKLF